MKKSKLVILIFIIAMCPITLCGCWNYKEIDSMAIVAGMAIDKDIITNKYTITVEIITSQSQGSSSIISSEFYSSEGDSILSAERAVVGKTGIPLLWYEAKVAIISESVARDGVIPVIDWSNRDSDLRADMWMIITKGNSAAEVLKNKFKPDQIVSLHLNDTMNRGKLLSKFPESKLWSFIDGIASEGKSEAVAAVKNGPSNGTIDHIGCAIFKSDKLVGYLNGDETLYMLMIKNKIKEGVITLKNVSNSDTSITLEIFENRTKLTPLYNNGKVSLIIDIYPVSIISEVGGSKDFMKEENLEILQSEAEKKIKTQVQYLISKLQKDYDCDVLGFGELFEKERPKVSENFKKNGEDIFTSLTTEVNVHLQIRASGKTIKPIVIGK
jgi:germination protein, Ger(x)C family